MGEGPAVEVAHEPTERVSRWWTLRFSLAWLGIWMAMLVPIQLALPDQLYDIDYADRLRSFGIVNAAAGVVTILMLPLFGAWCDRTTSRLGRRRVWVLGGTATFAVALFLLGMQEHVAGVVVLWVLATLGYLMMSAGLFAALADQVPDEQRGSMSAALYGPQAVAIVVGILLVGGLGHQARYAALAGALVVLTLPFLLLHRDAASAPRPPRARGSLREALGRLWIDPREHPDFGWVLGSRLLVNLGNALGTAQLLFFLRDALEVPDPEASLLELTLVYLAATLVATFGGGWLSDRLGRRRVFVALAAGLQACGGVLLAVDPSMGSAFVAAGLFGAGYGAFMSVDQALATAVLPEAEDRAKDLGIMNIASAAPQSFGPIVAAVVIGTLGGYAALFVAVGVVTTLGALAVYRVRSVP